jgi:hypothetical protein
MDIDTGIGTGMSIGIGLSTGVIVGHDVQQGEEAEQVVHGLVQRGFQLDGDQKKSIGPHGQEEEEAEWQGQPELPAGRCDKTIQEEV